MRCKVDEADRKGSLTVRLRTGPNNRGEERCGVRRKARMRRYLHSCKREGAAQEQKKEQEPRRSRRGARAARLFGIFGGASGWRAVFDGIRALSTETGACLRRRVLACLRRCLLPHKKLRTRCLGPGVFRSAGASCAPVALSLFLLGGCRAHDDLHQVAVIEHLAGHGLYVGVG